MIMTQSEKMVDDTRDPSGMTQQPQSPKVRLFRSFDLKTSLIVVACVLSTAFGEPGSTCNSETQFLVKHGDGSTSCEECPSCPPGQTLSIECGKQISPSTMIICAPCELGMSFSSKHGTSVCTPCSSCAKDQVVLQNCTLTQDIKCDKRCYGNGRYYDDDKGDCFPCTKCCNDGLDVVENECKEKLGTRSSMICSFHSSINRCVKSTAFPQEPTTTTDQSTITDDYTTQSQSSKHEHTISATAQPSHRFSQTKAAKHQDLLTPIGVSVALVLALLIIIAAVVLYIRKARKTANYLWCYNCDTETGVPDTGNHHKSTKGNHPGGLDMVEKGLEMTDKVLNHHISSTESMEPLLAEGKFEQELACSCQQESKLLSSLLNDALCLQKISEYLDATLAGVNNYRAVAQNYGVDHYKISSVLATHHRGPTTALIEWLAATHTELTVKDFAAVVRQKAKRNDVALLLEAYDSNKN